MSSVISLSLRSKTRSETETRSVFMRVVVSTLPRRWVLLITRYNIWVSLTWPGTLADSVNRLPRSPVSTATSSLPFSALTMTPQASGSSRQPEYLLVKICLANQRWLSHVSFCSPCYWHIVFLRCAKWVKSFFILPVLHPFHPHGCVSFCKWYVLFTAWRDEMQALAFVDWNCTCHTVHDQHLLILKF